MSTKLQKGDTEFFIPNLSFNMKWENVHIFSVTRGATAVPLQSVCNVEPIRVIFS